MPYWAIKPYGSCTDATEYQLMSVDPADATDIPAIVAMGPKVVLSVGGWNFPRLVVFLCYFVLLMGNTVRQHMQYAPAYICSSYFSKMVSSAESRGKFVNSVKSWMSKYSVHGVDLDWEFPCSPARQNPVGIHRPCRFPSHPTCTHLPH